jgi:hypothetical protein
VSVCLVVRHVLDLNVGGSERKRGAERASISHPMGQPGRSLPAFLRTETAVALACIPQLDLLVWDMQRIRERLSHFWLQIVATFMCANAVQRRGSGAGKIKWRRRFVGGYTHGLRNEFRSAVTWLECFFYLKARPLMSACGGAFQRFCHHRTRAGNESAEPLPRNVHSLRNPWEHRRFPSGMHTLTLPFRFPVGHVYREDAVRIVSSDDRAAWREAQKAPVWPAYRGWFSFYRLDRSLVCTRKATGIALCQRSQYDEAKLGHITQDVQGYRKDTLVRENVLMLHFLTSFS